MEKEKYNPSDTQLEIIMSDWLTGKRDESFVHKDTKNALTRHLGKDENLSDYLIGDATPIEVLKNARAMAQSVVSSMTPEYIQVKVGGKDSVTMCSQDESRTKRINVATDYFDRNDLTEREKIDIMTGFSVHEAAHVLYTDFGKDQKHNDGLDNIRDAINNIIEDERIEHLVGENTPGFADFLGVAKKHVWGDTEKLMKAQAVNESLPKFLRNFLYAVRYPSALNKEDVIDQYEQLSQVRQILTPFPKTYEGVINATEKIIDVMKDLAKEDEKKKEEQQKKEQQKEQNQKEQNQQSEQQNQQSQSSPQGQSSPEEALRKALDSNQAQTVQNIVNRAVNASQSKNSSKDANCIIDKNNEDIVNGEAECLSAGDGKVMYARKRRGSQNSYQLSYRRVSPFINAVKHALTVHSYEKDYSLQGCTSGRLNTYKLVSYKLGNNRIFTRQGEVKADSACVCILIDESGSMVRDRRMESARDTAVLINEAVSKISNIELFVYGYTSNELNIYKELNHTDKWGIGSTKATGGTPTGEAMACACKRIRKLTQNNCIMLVITDGQPADSEEVRKQDALLRKKNIYTIGVGIDNCCAVKGLFKESLVFNDLKELAPSLSHVVKNRLMNMMKRNDSLE